MNEGYRRHIETLLTRLREDEGMDYVSAKRAIAAELDHLHDRIDQLEKRLEKLES